MVAFPGHRSADPTLPSRQEVDCRHHRNDNCSMVHRVLLSLGLPIKKMALRPPQIDHDGKR